MNVTSMTVDRGMHVLRLSLTVTHLTLVSIGSINLLVILTILLKPYMRSITNVYIIGLCLANYIYLVNLILVAVAQLNNKSWILGSVMCAAYHGTETTGKYASVIFVVLLSADRYCAMCCTDLCIRYRNYRTAIIASIFAWLLAILAATPLYVFAEVAEFHLQANKQYRRICIAKWPSSTSARWYIAISSIFIYVLPLALMIAFNYRILSKLRDAVRSSRRLHRASKSRAPYHRVTRLVMWVTIFHAACWSPFWLFNLLTSVFRLRIHTRVDRLVINVIHLFPYFNCALNPLLYAVHAENFRRAFRSVFTGQSTRSRIIEIHKRNEKHVSNVIVPSSIHSRFMNDLPESIKRRCYWDRNHSVLLKISSDSGMNLKSKADLSMQTINENIDSTVSTISCKEKPNCGCTGSSFLLNNRRCVSFRSITELSEQFENECCEQRDLIVDECEKSDRKRDHLFDDILTMITPQDGDFML